MGESLGSIEDRAGLVLSFYVSDFISSILIMNESYNLSFESRFFSINRPQNN